jgi:hypothetical protein
MSNKIYLLRNFSFYFLSSFLKLPISQCVLITDFRKNLDISKLIYDFKLRQDELKMESRFVVVEFIENLDPNSQKSNGFSHPARRSLMRRHGQRQLKRKC